MRAPLPLPSVQMTHKQVTGASSYLFSVYDPFRLNLILDERKRMRKSRIDGVFVYPKSDHGTGQTPKYSVRARLDKQNQCVTINRAALCRSPPSPLLPRPAPAFSSPVSFRGAGLTNLQTQKSTASRHALRV